MQLAVATGAMWILAEQPTQFAGLPEDALRRAVSTDVTAGKADLSAAFEEIRKHRSA